MSFTEKIVPASEMQGRSGIVEKVNFDDSSLAIQVQEVADEATKEATANAEPSGDVSDNGEGVRADNDGSTTVDPGPDAGATSEAASNDEGEGEEGSSDPDPQQNPDYAKAQKELGERYERLFGELAKREAALAEKEKALENQGVSEENEAIKKFNELRRNGIEDADAAVEALSLLGLTYDEVTDIIANGKASPDIKVRLMQKRLDEQEAQKAKEAEEAQKAEQQKQYEARVEAAKEACTQEIKEAGEEFETLNAFGSYDAVFDVVAEKLNEGVSLSNKEAAKMVDDYLKKELMDSLEVIQKLSYMQDHFGKQIVEKVNKEPEPPVKQDDNKQLSGTLTNDMGQVSTEPDRSKELSRLVNTEESIRQAAKLIKFIE